MDRIFVVTGEGPNGLLIPLVPFLTKEDAEAFIAKFPKSPDGNWLDERFVEKDDPYTDDEYEHTEIGKALYESLFKDGDYYSGCGGCYSLKILEAEIGKPMVGWDLD